MGYPHDVDGAAADMPLRLRGLGIIERRAVSVLSEMFHGFGGCRPSAAALSGPPGSGKRLVVRELARTARLHGFVPVTSRLVTSRCAALWRGRSVFVIGDEADRDRWPAFLDAAVRDALPHVLLVVGSGEHRSIDTVRLERVAVDALVAAIRPRPLPPDLERAVRRAADRALGLPGRFARLLWPKGLDTHETDRRPARRRLPKVAEQPAVYGREELVDELLSEAEPACAWPAPGELATLRRRRDAAVVQLGQGKHAAGLRQLRQAIGGLARRSDWGDAADGAVALAGALLRRGRARDALAAIEDGRHYARRSGREAALLDLATLNGEAWIDLARLDEAESVLATALAAARAARDPARVMAASLALARGLYWRGQYADAAAVLGSLPRDVPALRVRHTLLAARIALGLRDVNRAMSLVLDAGESARAEGAAGNRAAVSCTAALVHLAVGDLHAVERDVAESMAAATAAHDPLRLIRGRLLRAEAERRRGRQAAALAQLERLRRLMATTRPDCRRAGSWRGRSRSATAIRRRSSRSVWRRPASVRWRWRVGSRGPAGQEASPSRSSTISSPSCASARPPTTRAACEGGLRPRPATLRAAGVAFAALLGRRADIICGDGARLDLGIVERAADAGITIAPHRRDDRIEAAAPVQYGGAPIGVLCARWPLGSTDDTSRAASVLTMSAAAAAPMVAATIARRQQPSFEGAGELLGVTPAMAELRKSVERAAAAPFSVLIDGESGSGKELVARAIHRGGPRRHRTFCTLNCAALPDDLVEAELFGHARGAFTGAAADRAGVFEEASGGTLFLDEIGELAARAQAKVLRVIQEGELRRVGGAGHGRSTSDRRSHQRDLHREGRAGDSGSTSYKLDVDASCAARDRREDIVVLRALWRGRRRASAAARPGATIGALARATPGAGAAGHPRRTGRAGRPQARGVASALRVVRRRPKQRRHGSTTRARTFEELRAGCRALRRPRGRAAAELGVTAGDDQADEPFEEFNSCQFKRARRARMRSCGKLGSLSRPRASVACAAARSPLRSCASASAARSVRSFGLDEEARSNHATAVCGSLRRSDNDAMRAALATKSALLEVRPPY
jgi:tetratricopeptide (TPR) repeat protein